MASYFKIGIYSFKTVAEVRMATEILLNQGYKYWDENIKNEFDSEAFIEQNLDRLSLWAGYMAEENCHDKMWLDPTTSDRQLKEWAPDATYTFEEFVAMAERPEYPDDDTISVEDFI